MPKTQRDCLLAQVRECFGKVTWSHKTHEIESSKFHLFDTCLIWAKIVLSALATGSGITSLFTEHVAKIATVVFTSSVFLIDLTFKNRDFAKKSLQHQAVATKLWRIREAYQSLIAELMSDGGDIAEVKKKNEELADALEKIYEVAPRTSQAAYNKATNRLHSGEGSCSASEVDLLLPPELKIGHD